MITTKDKIEQFKRDMRSYDYYLKKVVVLNQELEAIGVKLIGVSSPKAKDVICENSRNPYANNKLELMYQEERIINERNHTLRLIESIDEKLNRLETKNRELLIDLYIRRKTYERKSGEVYMSERNLKYHVNAIIKKII